MDCNGKWTILEDTILSITVHYGPLQSIMVHVHLSPLCPWLKN